ncbi:hypothetical protein CVD28_06295 [Bacillus sp. M6-12]|uniref:YjcZ family sporulation protein n=1 Tax=Bacillus sp. M6-12 TaxID=2054166 RepID=UPI000C787A3C|nr:YjcZ family sporulation protein [Bacillus sp. M6-12]PLS18724.1 hypothetical protein CVD28_06295 [Bacillus sp. M6-12]
MCFGCGGYRYTSPVTTAPSYGVGEFALIVVLLILLIIIGCVLKKGLCKADGYGGGHMFALIVMLFLIIIIGCLFLNVLI